MTRKRLFRLVFCCALFAFVLNGQGRNLSFLNVRNVLQSVGQNQILAKVFEIWGGRQTSVKRVLAWIKKQLNSILLKSYKLLDDYWNNGTKEQLSSEHRQESELDYRPDTKKEQLNRDLSQRPKLLNPHPDIKKVRSNHALHQKSKPLHYYRDTRQQEEEWDRICRNEKPLRYHRCMGELRNSS